MTSSLIYRKITDANAKLDIARFPTLCGERRQISEMLQELFLNLAIVNEIRTSFEIGAFEASFSRDLHGKLPNVRAVAFEANPIIHAHFSAEAAGSGVDYLNLAISDRRENLQLSVPTSINGHPIPELTRMSSMFRQKLESAEYRTVEARAMSLDEWIADHSCQPPYVVWIDVEGAQEKVLSGAGHALRNTALLLIELEKRPIWQGQADAAAIEAMLVNAGFEPVLRDIERPHQFNGLFLKSGLAEAPANRSLLADWGEDAFTMLARMV